MGRRSLLELFITSEAMGEAGVTNRHESCGLAPGEIVCGARVYEIAMYGMVDWASPTACGAMPGYSRLTPSPRFVPASASIEHDVPG